MINSSEPNVTSVARAHARVLLVEDNMLVAMALCGVLESSGYAVRVAHTGSDAIEHLTAGATGVDVMVCDVNLPGANGVELLRLSKSRAPERPVLMLSGDLLESDAQELVRLGAAHVMTKPVHAKELVDAVHAALAARR